MAQKNAAPCAARAPGPNKERGRLIQTAARRSSIRRWYSARCFTPVQPRAIHRANHTPHSSLDRGERQRGPLRQAPVTRHSVGARLMTITPQAQASERLTLTPEYSTPYNAIIRDDVVMGVSRYFIERWLPVLGPSAAALVNTLRQLDYRCQDDTIEISGAALAREAAMSRRHLYTCLDHPWIGAFVQPET